MKKPYATKPNLQLINQFFMIHTICTRFTLTYSQYHYCLGEYNKDVVMSNENYDDVKLNVSYIYGRMRI